MKRSVIVLCIFLYLQGLTTDIYPTNWWVGMKNNKLQLMLHGDNIGKFSKAVTTYPGVVVLKTTKTENLNYLFIDLAISQLAKAGKFKINLTGKGAATQSFEYELKTRNPDDGKTRVQGINSKDFIYLIIPDRFSNGDGSNDNFDNLRDLTDDMHGLYTRHGGDFKGIENHFDYLNKLGVTALWLTPVVENNTEKMTEWGNHISGYHGYWFTDHYQVDRRLGGNEGYKEFCQKSHANGFKVIQDAVYNHVSKQHWFILDPPSKDWINNWPSFTGPSHREETLFDPYASSFDKTQMINGWFIDHLPDLNLKNPFLANFLIQHAIWTTETFGIDGWRVDTYKYCDENFLNRVNTALMTEFPKITIFGEAWVNSVAGNAYFTQNNVNFSFKHNANGVIDFQTCFGMLAGMGMSQGWTDGVNKLYMTLAEDIVYKNPLNNVIFLDNHDMDRVFSSIDEEWSKLKMGITWLLTLRGIPQLYYGTEILMKNRKTSLDGASVRADFPGGWSTDTYNKFTKEGRTFQENETYNYISTLAGFRKNSSALTTGKTMQFVPVNGLYTYFRYDDKQTIMVVTNAGELAYKPRWDTYTERTKGFSKVRDVVTGITYSFGEIELQPRGTYVFELIN